MMKEPLLEVDQIQANILPGFKLPHLFFIAAKIKDKYLFSKFLSYLLPTITTAKNAIDYHSERIQKAKDRKIFGIQSFSLPLQNNLFWVNIGFGKDFLNNYNKDAETVDTSYKVGLAGRSFLLGDPRDPLLKGNKTHWLFGNETNEADFFLIVGSENRDYLMDRSKEIIEKIEQSNCVIIYSENGDRLENDVEHFGFKDGISQPALRGYVDQEETFFEERKIIKGNENTDSPEYASPGDVLIWPGQFVFGYPKQSPSHFRIPVAPSNNEDTEFLRNGSFLVFRRLEQDVSTFLNHTKELHFDLISTKGYENMSYDDFIASLVGRYKSGKPIIINGRETGFDFFNNFNYKSDTLKLVLKDGRSLSPVEADPQGFKCPMFAHIRKVYPRDKSTDQGAETNTQTFRILRRGIPFGPPYDFVNNENPTNNLLRGLHFLSYQTSIQNQFELLASKWMNEDGRPETKMGFDLIAGQNNEDGAENKRWCLFKNETGLSKKIEAGKNFVIPTGGGYFFCPSINAIQYIISLENM